MSHELRTPLNAIIGYSEIMLEDAEKEGSEERTDDLRKVCQSGRHLLGLINDVMDISKIEAGTIEVNLEQVDLAALLLDTADAVCPLVAKNQNVLEISNTSKVSEIEADAQKLRQCLLNLLSNASKFTKNGVIRLEVKDVSPGWVNISVHDTGVGMSAEQLSKVFEPFTQGDTSIAKIYGGTGLGLSITKKFTELMGGQLEVESSPGSGSRFTISVPVSHADAEGSTAQTA